MKKSIKTGLKERVLTALAIAHNFRRGATFVAALQEPRVAIPIVAAIAIHNIPEGIAVSFPYTMPPRQEESFSVFFCFGIVRTHRSFDWLPYTDALYDTVRNTQRSYGYYEYSYP